MGILNRKLLNWELLYFSVRVYVCTNLQKAGTTFHYSTRIWLASATLSAMQHD